MKKTLLTASLCAALFVLHAQKISSAVLKEDAIKSIDTKYDAYNKIALQIWGYAEVGYKEQKSSALISKHYKIMALPYRRALPICPLLL